MGNQRLFTVRNIKIILVALAVLPNISHSDPTLYEFDYNFVLPHAKAKMGNGIDAQTGSFSYSHSDIDIGVEGSTLALQRSYNSDHLSNPVASFGPGYRHNLDVYLVFFSIVRCSPGGPVVHCAPETHVTVSDSGKSVLFAPNFQRSGYWNYSYDGSKLEESTVWYQGKQHDVLTYTDTRDGRQVHFDKTDWSWGCNAPYRSEKASALCVRASHIDKADGSFIAMKNERTSNNIVRLKEAVNERGFGLRFSYGANSHLISQVAGFRIGCQTTVHIECNTGAFPQVSYSYTSGRLSQYANSVGYVRYYDYNLNDLLVSERTSDAQGVKLFENTYHAGMQLWGGTDNVWYPVLSQSDDRGNNWTFSYAYPGDDLDEGGVWVQYTYSKQTDPQGGITEFYFDQDEDGAGAPLYDGSGSRPVHTTSPSSVVDANGVITRYKHYRYGDHPPKETTYASGAMSKYEHGGAVIRRVAVPGSGLADQILTTQWHSCAGGWRDCGRKPDNIIDAMGAEVDFQYDSTHGGLTAILLPPNASGQRSLIKRYYQAFYPAAGVSPGLPWLTVAPTYLATQMERCLSASSSVSASCPSAQRLTATNVFRASSSGSRSSHEMEKTIVDEGGLSITNAFIYDKVGNVIKADGPLSIDDVVLNAYDSYRRLVSAVGPKADSVSLHQATRNYYNAKGQLIRTAQGTQTSRTAGYINLRTSCSTFDASGRITSQLGFGISGSSLQCPNENNSYTTHTTKTYDTLGRKDVSVQVLASGQGPDRQTKTVYYPNGLVHKVIRAFGTSIQQDYQTYTYNGNNQIATVADANGNTTSYAYDGHDRLSSLTFADGSVERYGYDQNNNRTSKVTRDGQTIQYSFDPRNQLVGKTVPGARSSDPTAYSFVYDLAGRKVSDNYWSVTQQYSYDKAGRLTQKTHWGAGMPVSYEYNAAGNVTRFTYPDGWQSVFAYDVLGRVTSAKEGSAPANEQPNRTLAAIGYDDLSRRSWISFGNGAQTIYDYSMRDDLTQHSSVFTNSDSIDYTYSYNKVAQTIARTVSDPLLSWSPDADAPVEFYSANSLNQYTQARGHTLSYDGKGNLTNAGNGWSFEYDADNGLSRAYLNNALQAHYVHYADGNRRYKSANGVVERYYYSGDQEIYETGNSLTDKRRRYVRIPGTVDEAILMLDYTASQSNPTNLWVHWDRSGSTIATSGANGNANERIAYSPYGESTSTSDFPFRYTGQKLDQETGLYYYKARYYNPEIGRFLQTDPVGYGDNMNLYAYVANDPLNATDPTGRVLRLIVSGGKIIKRTIKARGNVFKAVRDEIVDVIDTGSTLIDPSASTFEKIVAVAELASGIDLPGSSAARKAPDPLPIDGRKHGGDVHDARINEVAENARAKGATDIRKNQVQVDADGNVVGDNLPDLQFNTKDGTHVNFEVDNRASASQKHLDRVTTNDPCAVTICEVIKSK